MKITETYFQLGPELSGLSLNESLMLSVPFDGDGAPDKCNMFDVNYTSILQVRGPILLDTQHSIAVLKISAKMLG